MTAPKALRRLVAAGRPEHARRRRARAILVLAFSATLWPAGANALAATAPVSLGAADSFAVLAGTTVTNNGATVVTGDFGVSPGSTLTGFPPGTVRGTIHAADAAGGSAQRGLSAAYADAASRSPSTTVTSDLGARVLTAGVYRSASSLALTGTLTLNGQGNPNAVFIFQAGSTLTTATASHVTLVNGAQACNVFWQVASSATLGASSSFAGDIAALASISMGSGVTLAGRALASTGAVTLIGDTISAAHCVATAPVATGPTGAGSGASGATSTGTTTGPGNVHVGSGTLGPQAGAALFNTVPGTIATTVADFGIRHRVRGHFKAVITGVRISRVVFTLDGHVIATDSQAPFAAAVLSSAGVHTLIAGVTFTDGTPSVALSMRYRSAAKSGKHGSTPSAPHASLPAGRGGVSFMRSVSLASLLAQVHGVMDTP